MIRVLTIDRPTDGVLFVQFNKPERRNAFDQGMRDALMDALDCAEADATVRVVLLTGDERSFVAGADLSEVASADAADMATARLHHIWDRLEHFVKPLVMAVRGYALGAGCELALHADILIAAEDACFGQPEIRVGIQPGAGGITRMISRVGWTRAMLLAMCAETISGRTAAEWGLAAEAVPPERTLARALDIAAKIAALPAARATEIKQVGRQVQDMGLTDGLALERAAYWRTFGTPDQKEGMAAFLEKRPAQFNQGIQT
jgi:enoyl-CoA hydratase/carnithine racemase